MVKLNVFSSNRAEEKERYEREFEEFIKEVLKMNTREKMRDFLEGLLTPKELREILNRLEIVKMLKRGVSQHDIAGKLRVGVATVGRGSRELQKGRLKYV